jgi:hypothetical protein
MYRFTRYATLQNAAIVPQAIGWSTELCGYLNKTYKLPLKAGVELFGNLNVHWEFEMDSLDKMSELNTKLLSDKSYLQMLEKGKDFWVAGTVKDQIVNFVTP